MEIDELRYMMARQDRRSITLIVEGHRDALFLSELTPLTLRNNASVYSINDINIPVPVDGGARGRILWLADILALDQEISGRIFFFIDADLDRFTGKLHHKNVIMSDMSDFESYVLNGCSLSHILYQFGKSDEHVAQFERAIIRICKPLKLLRAAAIQAEVPLVVNQTLGERRERFARYAAKKGFESEISWERVRNAVFTNSKLSAENRSIIDQAIEKVSCLGLPDNQCLQGKDLSAAIAIVFNINFDEASRLIAGAIKACIDTIRIMPTMAHIDHILKR